MFLEVFWIMEILFFQLGKEDDDDDVVKLVIFIFFIVVSDGEISYVLFVFIRVFIMKE